MAETKVRGVLEIGIKLSMRGVAGQNARGDETSSLVTDSSRFVALVI